MADQWQELNSDDHGNTIDHTGRIVNDDGAEPHGPGGRLTDAADQLAGRCPHCEARILTGPELLDAMLEARSRYASVSEHGAIEVAITPELHAQIERALTRAVNYTRDVDERPDVDPGSDAAPDLLKAGRALADKIAAYGLPPEYLLDEWRAMRSAIAKALGQSQ